MNSGAETARALNPLIKPWILLFAVASGVAIAALAVWGAQRWREEQAYQAWRTRRRPAIAWGPVNKETNGNRQRSRGDLLPPVAGSDCFEDRRGLDRWVW
jgi:hypothetical protein